MNDQLRMELRYSMDLANSGCSMNEMGVECGDGPFEAIMAAGCPMNQTEVDSWVASYGCCVGSFMMDMMEYGDLTGTPPCAAGTPPYKVGKGCKAPKWKMPLNPPPPPPNALGKGGKAGVAAGAVVGGVAGLGAVGMALRRRKANNKKAAKRPAEMAMAAPAVVAV